MGVTVDIKEDSFTYICIYHSGKKVNMDISSDIIIYF